MVSIYNCIFIFVVAFGFKSLFYSYYFCEIQLQNRFTLNNFALLQWISWFYLCVCRSNCGHRRDSFSAGLGDRCWGCWANLEKTTESHAASVSKVGTGWVTSHFAAGWTSLFQQSTHSGETAGRGHLSVQSSQSATPAHGDILCFITYTIDDISHALIKSLMILGFEAQRSSTSTTSSGEQTKTCCAELYRCSQGEHRTTHPDTCDCLQTTGVDADLLAHGRVSKPKNSSAYVMTVLRTLLLKSN